MKREKQITLVHTQYWKPNPFTKRLQGTTVPHLGTNMYAAERTKPPVPLKLEDKSTKPNPIPTKVDEPQITTPLSGASTEFNQLANLIGLAADEALSGKPDDFKLNLFPDAVFDAEGGRLGAGDSGQIINIDLGKGGKEQVKKAMKEFESLDLMKPSQEATGDDLLDLMDSL